MGDIPVATRPARSLVLSTDALEPILELGVHADRAGFDRVWTTEYLHRDAVVRALAIAMKTERIGVATGIAYAFTRPALAAAAAAADVHRLSKGRFAMGLGPGTRGVRRWYDADFEPPARRLADYARALAAAFDDNDQLRGAPELFAAALSPTLARHVAGAFDGVLLHPLALSRAHLDGRLLPALRDGAEARSRPIRTVMWCITSVDDDEERARDRARAQLAFYFSTPSYAAAAAGCQWEAVPARVIESHRSEPELSWEQLGALVTDEMVDELTLTGTPDSVRRRCASLEDELVGRGIDEVAFAAAGAGQDADAFRSSCAAIVDALRPSPSPVERTPGAVVSL